MLVIVSIADRSTGRFLWRFRLEEWRLLELDWNRRMKVQYFRNSLNLSRISK